VAPEPASLRYRGDHRALETVDFAGIEINQPQAWTALTRGEGILPIAEMSRLSGVEAKQAVDREADQRKSCSQLSAASPTFAGIVRPEPCLPRERVHSVRPGHGRALPQGGRRFRLISSCVLSLLLLSLGLREKGYVARHARVCGVFPSHARAGLASIDVLLLPCSSPVARLKRHLAERGRAFGAGFALPAAVFNCP